MAEKFHREHKRKPSVPKEDQFNIFEETIDFRNS